MSNDKINTGSLTAEHEQYQDGLLLSDTAASYSQMALSPRVATSEGGRKVVPVIAMDEDFIKITGQKFAVLSFIDASQYKALRSDDGISMPSHLIKIRGVFNSADAAKKHVEQMRRIDCHFDYHVVCCHRWTPIGAHMCSEQEWSDKTINDTMQSYFEKEDETISNLQHRLKVSKQDQSLAADDIWNEAQKLKTAEQNDSLFACETIMPVTMTLMEAAKSAQITA